MPRAEVRLGNHTVGILDEQSDGRIAFRATPNYAAMSPRPVLSQIFEDDIGRSFVGPKGGLPTFFANLLPEGPLRELLERSLGVDPRNDMALLLAVGRDLPGAVEVVPSQEDSKVGSGESGSDEIETRTDHSSESLRFSIAGIQLKFSMLDDQDRLTLATRERRGEWIVKFPSNRYEAVPENEFTVLSWARQCGFDVPECGLWDASALPESLQRLVDKNAKVLAVKRFDRRGSERLHQEDLAQATNTAPAKRYDFTYEKCATLLVALGGEAMYLEFIRRLAFIIVSGNGDAHLKNWSLMYPDGLNAQLAPLYDQVSTCAWPDFQPPDLALKLSGHRRMREVSMQSFTHLAERTGMDPLRTADAAREVVRSAVSVWQDIRDNSSMPVDQREAVERHWEGVPFVREAMGQP